MATARGVSLALAALLALLAVAGASTLTVWDGPGCTGTTITLSCGKCHSINSTMNGGFYYLHTGGAAKFYNSDGCSDWPWPFPAKYLNDDTWYCSKFAYKSVMLTCSSTLGDITDQQQQQQ